MKIGVQAYNYLEDYLAAIRAKGRYAFTIDELKDKFDISDKAIHQNVDGSTENTVYGEDLYYTIEEAVKNAVNYKEE